MARIITEITNGPRRLVISETLLIRPAELLRISIPLTPSPPGTPNDLELYVSFRPDVEVTRFDVIAGNAMQLHIKQMPPNATVGGFEQPLSFSLDKARFEFFASFVRITASIIQMTFTIYQMPDQVPGLV